MKQTYATVNIRGIEFPTIQKEGGRTSLLHSLQPDGTVASAWQRTEEEAPDVRAAKRGDVSLMMHFAGQEILRDLCDRMAIHVPGRQGPLMGTGNVPYGTIISTPDGFIKNEGEAAEYAEDFDGDQGHLHSHGGYGLFTKFPNTQRDSVKELWRQDSQDIHEVFMPLPNLDALVKAEAEIEYDLVEQGLKVLQPNTTGTVTSEWNVKELYEASSLETFGDRLLHLFGDYGRYEAIELRGLKGRSKDANQTDSIGDETTMQVIQPQHAWAFYPNRIGKLFGESLLWVFNTDLDRTMNEIMDLRLQFATVETSGKVTSLEPVRYDDELLTRLLDLGLANYMELPRHPSCQREGIPNPIMFWLCRPGTKYVSLVDTKRGHHHRAFAYVIPPVWRRFGKTWRLLKPLDALRMVLSECEVHVKNSEGEFVREFPTRIQDMSKYPWLTAKLLKHIQKHIGALGAVCPATRLRDGSILPTVMAQGTASRTITVDFGTKEFSPLRMMEGVQLLNGITPIAIAGGKGSSQRFRKYAFARSNGTPEWAREEDHPRRSANQLAQLLQSHPLPRMTVAIAQMRDTKSQVLITPSGIEKQTIKDLFLPRISEEQDDEFTLEQRYTGWDGRIYRCFTGSAKETREIGKIIDAHGMKFVPRRYDQAYYTTGHGRDTEIHNIDLIIPIEELEGKGCLRSWLKDSKRISAMIGDQEAEVILVERSLFRTGCGSENVAVRNKTMKVRGMDRLCVWSEYLQMHPEELSKPFMGLPVPDLTYAKAKIEACIAIAESLPDPEDSSGDDSEPED